MIAASAAWRLFLRNAAAAVALGSLPVGPSYAAGGVPGLWIGSREKDPITDKWNSLAFIYDNEGQGTLGLRCKSEHPDVLVVLGEPTFTVGKKVSVTYRLDAKPAAEVPAIATEPRILAVDYRQADLLVPILRTKKITLRFPGQFGREITMTFEPALPTNTLHLVGQVVSDCNLAPYPKEELENAMRALDTSGSKRRKP